MVCVCGVIREEVWEEKLKAGVDVDPIPIVKSCM